MRDTQELEKMDREAKVARDMTIEQLITKRNSFFNRTVLFTKGEKDKYTLDYIVRRTFESLPKNVRKYIEGEKQQLITSISNTIYTNPGRGFSPYSLLYKNAIDAKRRSYDGTKEEIWKRFRNEYNQMYLRYKNYMARRRLSASSYWFENVELKIHGSVIESTCELPGSNLSNNLIRFSLLEIDMDYSRDDLRARLS